MRKKIERVVSVLILTVIIIISICRVSNLLQLKESDNRYAAFFAEKNQFDVFFLGSSHVRFGFFPMELWADRGITSYNLGGEGNPIPVSYWVLVNALDYQVPKVVVMDVFNMWPGEKFHTLIGQAHASLDAFPLSIHKYRMVMDLIDDEDMTDRNGNSIYDKRWEFLFDLGEYHTRWNSLGIGDFADRSTLESNSAVWRGGQPVIQIVQRNEHIYEKSDDLYYDEIAKDYLERMIQLCADKNIDLLLINTGYDCSDEAKYFADSVNEIAEQYGILYIDFTELDIINFESDLQSSGNTHVNFSGAEKFTTFIGQILVEQYQLSDHREDEEYASWWSDYQRFVSSKADYLKQQTALDLYLLLLADDDYNIMIEMLDTSIISEGNNPYVLENLGIDMDKLNQGSNLLAIDMSSREISYLCNDYESGSKWTSVLGEISLWEDIDEEQSDIDTYKIYLNDQEMYTASLSEPARIRLTVIRRDSGEVVDVHIF